MTTVKEMRRKSRRETAAGLACLIFFEAVVLAFIWLMVEACVSSIEAEGWFWWSMFIGWGVVAGVSILLVERGLKCGNSTYRECISPLMAQIKADENLLAKYNELDALTDTELFAELPHELSGPFVSYYDGFYNSHQGLVLMNMIRCCDEVVHPYNEALAVRYGEKVRAAGAGKVAFYEWEEVLRSYPWLIGYKESPLTNIPDTPPEVNPEDLKVTWRDIPANSHAYSDPLKKKKSSKSSLRFY